MLLGNPNLEGTRFMKLRLSIVLATLLVLAAGCRQPQGTQTEPSPSPHGAGLQGEADSLTVYSGRGENLVGPIFEQFQTETGIQLNVKYGDTAELAALILEEGTNSPADIFFAQDAGGLGAVAKEGLFVDLPSNLLDLVPQAFAADNGQWVGISGRSRVVVYNTDGVKEADLPASIDGFTDEQWKGRVGWSPTNGSFQSFVTAYRKLKGDAAAEDWLNAMKVNDTKVYEGNSPIVKAVGAGEIQVGLVNHYYLLNIKKDDPGITAANHFYSNGGPEALVNVAGAGILKSSRAQKTAGELLRFLLSSEGQEYFVQETSEYPLIEGVDPLPTLPALSELDSPDIDLSDLDDLEGTLELLRQVGLI